MPANERARADAVSRHTPWMRRWQLTLTRVLRRLNADAGLPPRTDNTHLADSSQLGRGGALLLSCMESSFHRVRRDKAAWSFFCSTRLKPLEGEKSFHAVPLRAEVSVQCERPAKEHGFLVEEIPIPPPEKSGWICKTKRGR